jgi:hypothetical protein
MAKSFFKSLINPEYGKPDALGRQTITDKKNSKSNKSSNHFGGLFTGGSMGPVCGPNGCS